MTNRITGTNSGIDVDTVVKQSLTNEQNKIDKAYQQQKVYEYQQEQLKEIVSSSQDFYDKYLDVTSGKNLLLTSAYQTATFTSSNTAISAKGFAGADAGRYSISVDKMATTAKTTIKAENFTEVLKEKEGVIAVKMKNSSGEDVLAYCNVEMTSGGEIDMTKTAKNLTTALNKAGINVSAKYSDFTKGITLESGELGEKIEFQAVIKEGISEEDLAKYESNDSSSQKVTEAKVDALGEEAEFSKNKAQGGNAEGSITKDGNIYRFNQKSNVVTVDNVQFTINSAPSTTEEKKPSDFSHLAMNTKGAKVVLEKGNLVTTMLSGEVISTSKTYSDGIVITKGINGNTVKGDLTALSETDKNVEKDKNSTDTNIILSKLEDGITTETTIEKDKDGNIISTTTTKTYDDKSKVTSVTKDGKTETSAEIKDKFEEGLENGSSKTTITSADEKTQTIIEKDEDGNETTTTTQIQKDGSEIKLVDNETEVTKSEAVTLTGEINVDDLKNTIIDFVNDYNNLMQSINDKLWETRDTDYMPLTEDQKSEMTDSQIESWEKKAQTGLLRNDSDLKRIQNAMKTAMSSFMSGTGLTLESIGIEPVDNYTTKNGTFKIDEEKLTKALQENGANVKDLFTRSASGDEKGGVLVQLQSTLKSEFKSSSSALSKKIGFSGTSTENSNTLSKYITKQKKLITELKDKYSDKETALYKKYSNLETMLEKLNAQSSSLYSMLGISQ